MDTSIFDLFSIGIGPSSSHTVGPMRAGYRAVCSVKNPLHDVLFVQVHLYGSLACTGKGHQTDVAVQLGLMGLSPESINPKVIPNIISLIQSNCRITLNGEQEVSFNPRSDIIFKRNESLPEHSNGMDFVFKFTDGSTQHCRYFSIGGGFVVSAEDWGQPEFNSSAPVPYPFSTGLELLEVCKHNQLSIADVLMANESIWHIEGAVRARLDLIWQVMNESIDQGCTSQGILCGGLNVRRRAYEMHQRLSQPDSDADALDWLNLYALAVNEENAAGRRVVTAPTNGASGIMPSVLRYHMSFNKKAKPSDPEVFLLTAAAIGMLFKKNASISAAEVGCQGEVGVACSMAAAGLCALLGGTPEQVENAAEIGMEHNLGLTCDPIGGLVQIPCIERNASGAVQAISAAKLALYGDGIHHVSLDEVIETMHQTGKDMQFKYKETADGGLAVKVKVSEVEC